MSGSLAHSPGDVIRYLLIELGVGTLPSDDNSWPIYAGRMPDKPDSCIAVAGTVGTQDGRLQVTGEVQEHYGFQVTVRAPSHQLGFVKANAIAVAMDQSAKLDTITISTSVYLVYSISSRGQVIDVGKETTSNRNLFTINAVASIRQTA